MMLEPAVERAPAQPQRLGRLADVAAVALERLPDQHALDFLQRQVLEPRRGAAAAEPEIGARGAACPAPCSTARSIVWSSSRTLPGHACASSAASASGSNPASGFR